MSIADNDEGQVLSPETWGQFNLYRAEATIMRLLKGQAQHIALVLAHETIRRRRKDGIIEITHRELAELSGRAKDTIPVAMAECVEAGLLHQRRIRDGFRYTWGRVAYFPTTGTGVVDANKKSSSDSSSSLRDAVQRVLDGIYLDKLQRKHGILPNSPGAKKRLWLTADKRNEIIDNLVFAAEAVNWDAEHVTEKALGKWFESDGRDAFLKRTRHPFIRFADDVELIVCNLIAFENHKRRSGIGNTTQPTERVEQLVSNRPEIRAANIAGGAGVIAAMGYRPSLVRPDFKLAANA